MYAHSRKSHIARNNENTGNGWERQTVISLYKRETKINNETKIAVLLLRLFQTDSLQRF